MSRRDEEFAEWVAARSAWLQRTAFLMCGDRALAEDLTQTTLVKVYVSWHRIQRREAVDGYARRTLARVCIDESRRPWRRESVVADGLGDRADVRDAHGGVDDRDVLLDALRALPDRQRVAVVLRHWQDLSVTETAEAMGCTESAVKTHTSRGVARLRELLSDLTLTNGEPA